MDLLPQFIMNGIIQGSNYALLAMGLSMTYSIMRMVNFAHAQLYMISAYLCYSVMKYWISNYLVAIVLATIAGAILGWLIERIVLRRAQRQNLFVISLGLVIVAQEVAFIIWEGFAINFSTPLTGLVSFGPVTLTQQKALVIVVAIVVELAVLMFFRLSRFGKAMVATSANEDAAQLMGINAHTMSSAAFTIGTLLAALAGSLVGPLFSLTPGMGTPLSITALIVIIFGGIGSIGGAIIGAYTIGILQSVYAGLASPEWSTLVGFVILIIMLSFRPRGLFGRE
ncbi:MAG: branched-chain amino acid ABC transporter permease [Dehalococcoidales bacterium]|nr:branched-chain amino acid ABC transporter permease [Dehalococcoidales bacterium]